MYNPYYEEMLKLISKYNLNLDIVVNDFEHIYCNIAGEDAERALELQKDYYYHHYHLYDETK